MKIHATRVSAPTAEHAHGTKWQVAVTLADGSVKTFRRVIVDGPSETHALPEHLTPESQPRVWCEPRPGAKVWGITDEAPYAVRLDTPDERSNG